jgi:hypothetical protein
MSTMSRDEVDILHRAQWLSSFLQVDGLSIPPEFEPSALLIAILAKSLKPSQILLRSQQHVCLIAHMLRMDAHSTDGLMRMLSMQKRESYVLKVYVRS